MEKIKKAICGLTGTVSALFGWFGWLIVAFVACMALDYTTGTWAAARQGRWSSAAAREGIAHKLGSIAAVLVAAIADGALGILINQIPALPLPFGYTALLCPLVLVWYIFTELGSVLENIEKLGAPLPAFLRRILESCRIGVEAAAKDETPTKR